MEFQVSDTGIGLSQEQDSGFLTSSSKPIHLFQRRYGGTGWDSAL
jgi:hypothetical protein